MWTGHTIVKSPMLSQKDCLSELEQLLDENASKNRFYRAELSTTIKILLKTYRIIAVNEDHGDGDAPELSVSTNSQCAVFKTPFTTLNFYL